MVPPSSRHRVGSVGLVRLALLLVVSMMSLSGTASAFAAPSPEAGGVQFSFTAWQVAELTTSGNPTETVAAADAITMAFGEDDTVMVETANHCATATGTIALHDDRTVVPNLSVPTDGTNQCERRSVEERFLNLVNLATTWTLNEDRLTLELMDGGTIVLTQTITGTTWEWVEFQSGKGDTVTPEADEPTTIVFGTDGMVTMTTSCVTLTAPYTLDGASGLTIDTSALPERTDPCAIGARSALESMRSYVFRDGRLFTALMADAGIYEFVAVAAHG